MQWADPVTGSSSMLPPGAKKRETKTPSSACLAQSALRCARRPDVEPKARSGQTHGGFPLRLEEEGEAGPSDEGRRDLERVEEPLGRGDGIPCFAEPLRDARRQRSLGQGSARALVRRGGRL